MPKKILVLFFLIQGSNLYAQNQKRYVSSGEKSAPLDLQKEFPNILKSIKVLDKDIFLLEEKKGKLTQSLNSKYTTDELKKMKDDVILLSNVNNSLTQKNIEKLLILQN